MKQFVVYEVWTRSRVVEAVSEEAALEEPPSQPSPNDLSLCNWHAVEIPTREPGMRLDYARPLTR